MEKILLILATVLLLVGCKSINTENNNIQNQVENSQQQNSGDGIVENSEENPLDIVTYTVIDINSSNIKTNYKILNEAGIFNLYADIINPIKINREEINNGLNRLNNGFQEYELDTELKGTEDSLIMVQDMPKAWKEKVAQMINDNKISNDDINYITNEGFCVTTKRNYELAKNEENLSQYEAETSILNLVYRVNKEKNIYTLEPQYYAGGVQTLVTRKQNGFKYTFAENEEIEMWVTYWDGIDDEKIVGFKKIVTPKELIEIEKNIYEDEKKTLEVFRKVAVDEWIKEKEESNQPNLEDRVWISNGKIYINKVLGGP